MTAMVTGLADLETSGLIQSACLTVPILHACLNTIFVAAIGNVYKLHLSPQASAR